MSSLAAARADNFYHPPDWDPRRQSRAEASGAVGWKAHPLRERAKKLASEGVLVIRFEMPFDVRCSHCGNRIAKGVRFDAEKKCVGKYLSTKIWSFRMLCAAEDGTTRTARQLSGAHHIEVRTDPQSGDYVVVSGAQKVEQTARSAAELGVETLLDPDEQKRLEADPFYKLERDAPRAAQRKARQPWQAALQQKQEGLWADDYAMSQALRRAHRGGRAAAAADAAANAAKGIRVPLVAERPDDVAAARAVEFGAAKRKRSDAARGEKRLRLLGGSALGGALAPAAAAAEEERLRLLQLRRSRGMRITAEPHKPTAAAAAAARGRGPPLRVEQAVPAYLIDRRKPKAAAPAAAAPAKAPAAGLVDYSDDSDGCAS
jgi:coiled-coil domain-containing protein 130